MIFTVPASLCARSGPSMSPAGLGGPIPRPGARGREVSCRASIPGEHPKPRVGNFLNLAVPSPAGHSRSLGPSFLTHVNSTDKGNSQSSRGTQASSCVAPSTSARRHHQSHLNLPQPPSLTEVVDSPATVKSIPVNTIHSEATNSDLVLLIHLGCAVTVGQLAPGVPEPLLATSPPKPGPLSLTASLTAVHTNA